MDMGLRNQALEADREQQKCNEGESAEGAAKPLGSAAQAKGLVNRNPQEGLPDRYLITLSLFAA
jgi:hypothetical protein